MKQKNIIKIWIIALFVITLQYCDSTEPKPPDTNPPGNQEDIPWPSLADSPWPMINKNTQANTRVNSSSNINGQFSEILDIPLSSSGIVFDTDSTFIFISVSDSGYLVKADISGNIIWQSTISHLLKVVTAPLLLSSKRIATVGGDYITNSIYCFNELGNLIWKLKLGESVSIDQSTITVDKNGRIYAYGNGSLFVVSQSGELINTIMNDEFYGYAVSQLTFSPDGNTAYIAGNEKTIIAIDLTIQNIKWTYGEVKLKHTPVVDSKGDIYFIPYNENPNELSLVKINRNGERQWEFRFSSSSDITAYNPPTIDYRGNIIFASDTLYSLNNDGKLNWQASLNGIMHSRFLIDASDNISFFTIDNNSVFFNQFSAEGNIIHNLSQNIENGYFTGQIAFVNQSFFFPINGINKILIVK